MPGLIHSIEDGPSGGDQLHQEVEVADVAAEDHAPALHGAEEDQRVVHGAATVVGRGMLQTGQDAGEDGGFAPDCAVGIEDAVGGPMFDHPGDPTNNLSRSGMGGIEASAQVNQFRFDDRRMPGLNPRNFPFQLRSKFVMQDVDVKRGIEQDGFRQEAAVEKERPIVSSSRWRTAVPSSQRRREVSTQDRYPGRWCRSG